MSDLTGSDKPVLGADYLNESVLLKTVRLSINLLTNIMIFLTIFVVLLYSCRASTVTYFDMHIILCVLGYQLFMSQGILVLSRYNSWSMHLPHFHKKYLHIGLQVFGFILVIIGSLVILLKQDSHFNSTHGTLGILSLIFSTLTILNGIAANYAYKLCNGLVFLIKFIHYISGVLSLMLSAAAVTLGFKTRSFYTWASNEGVTALVCVTWVFSVLVTIDFWLLAGQRLKRLG